MSELELTRGAIVKISKVGYPSHQSVTITRHWMKEVGYQRGGGVDYQWEDYEQSHTYTKITPSSAKRLQALLDEGTDDWTYRWLISTIAVDQYEYDGEPRNTDYYTTYTYLNDGEYQVSDFHLSVTSSNWKPLSWGASDTDEVPF